jgi:hypothetical protein
LHFILEGSSGVGLTALAKFVSLDYLRSNHLDQQIPWILLGQKSAIENIIATFNPQSLNKMNEISIK